MDASSHPQRYVWRVGDLVVDDGQQLVMRGDEVIELPKLSFDLLLELARSAPNVVSIDTLLTRVWPNVVVNPETVVQRVKMLRDALDDRAAEPRYITVVRGRGYRLVAEVSRTEVFNAPGFRHAPHPIRRALHPASRPRLCRKPVGRVDAVSLLCQPLPWCCSEPSDCGPCSAVRYRYRRHRTPMTRRCARSPCCRSRT